MKVDFVSEDIDFQLDRQNKYEKWLTDVSQEENRALGEIVYRFVSEDRILEINKEYLNHDYLTDIITFNNSFLNELNGDIYICIDVVRSNSMKFSEELFEKELQRVIVHGLLHLMGYNDSTEKEIHAMRVKEDYYMNKLPVR